MTPRHDGPATRRRKLPARFAPVVMPFLLSLLMTCLVSLISTARSVGITPELPRLWVGSWARPGWWPFRSRCSFCRWCAA